MILPGYLFSLYGTLLVAAIATGLLSSYRTPLPTEGRRLSDAGERAGMEQSLAPIKHSLLLSLFVAAASAFYAHKADASLVWFTAVPLVVSIFSIAVPLVAARSTIRTASRVPFANDRDGVESLCGRSALSATLLFLSLAGLLTSGIFSFASRVMAPELAVTLVGFGCAGAAATSISFAQSGATLLGTTLVTGTRDRRLDDGAHPATLAEVVAQSFGRAAMTGALFFLVASLAHFLILKKSLELRDESHAAVWLYAHGLPALTPLAILFAGLTLRTSDSEEQNVPIRRTLFVAFSLFVAAAWSLAQTIADVSERRALAMGATVLFFGMAILVLVVSTNPRRQGRIPIVARARILKWSGSALASLVFFEVTRTLLERAKVPSEVAEAILLGGLLSTFGLLYFLSFTRGIHVTLRAASSLLTAPNRDHESSVSPSLSPLLWMIAALIGLLAAGLRTPKELLPWTVSAWAILGAALPLLGTIETSELVRRHRAELLSLTPDSETGETRLGDALLIAGRAVRSGAFFAPVAALLVPLALLGLRALWGEFPFESAGYGASLGALLLGGALVSLFDESEPEPFFGHAALLFSLSLAAVTFITLGRLSLSP